MANNGDHELAIDKRGAVLWLSQPHIERRPQPELQWRSASSLAAP